MHLYAKLYQNIQGCSRDISISLTDHIQTDGRTDLHSDHSADSRVLQEYSADARAMQHSVDSRVVQF